MMYVVFVMSPERKKIMSFNSQHAPRIWDDLYGVYIPDFLTRNTDYIRRFGVPSSGDKKVDEMMSNDLVFVRIPIIKILEYFDQGVEVQIPVREDMLTIHKNIELYLDEWRMHIRVDINSSAARNKQLLLNLEKLSKLIFDKARGKELINNMFTVKSFGLMNPLAKQAEEKKDFQKPDYDGISQLLRPKVVRGRF